MFIQSSIADAVAGAASDNAEIYSQSNLNLQSSIESSIFHGQDSSAQNQSVISDLQAIQKDMIH